MFDLSGPVLLATDLSARCDRALDRAVLLAAQRRATLIALHVVEPRGMDALAMQSLTADQLARVERRLAEDLGRSDAEVRCLVRRGEPAQVACQVADEHNCALVVCGVARDEPLGRQFTGTTVDRLVRQARRPVLVVRRRAHAAYRNVIVACDFSNASRRALRVSLGLTGPQWLTLFHAMDLPARGKDQVSAQGFQRTAEDAAADFMAATPGMQKHPLPRVEIAAGRPERIIPDYAWQSACELLVVGSHGRGGGAARAALGSVAERLLERAPCDVLVVQSSAAS
jgi:nucleotide-binding universal stress UspA family protein